MFLAEVVASKNEDIIQVKYADCLKWVHTDNPANFRNPRLWNRFPWLILPPGFFFDDFFLKSTHLLFPRAYIVFSTKN